MRTLIGVRAACASLAAMLAMGSLLAGCGANPEKAAERMEQSKPTALAAAKDAARLYYNCPVVTATLLSSDPGGKGSAYELDRPVHTVETSGCGKRSVFTVVCSKNGSCSALADSAAGDLSR